jgi:hypothetical protein
MNAQQSQPSPPSDHEQSELLALYQVTTQDLAFFKSQQWTLVNYGLLALAAVAAIPQITGLSPNQCVRWALCGVEVLVTFITAWLVWRLHGSIHERRKRLKRVYDRLSDEFRRARGDKKSVSAWEMAMPLQVVLLIALGLSAWVTLCAT